ncbi:hypothetical protein Nepgr_000761 [Nepenthes gracilis]|uniref:Uncharacterized protein n=1 Tax=Nepenthes gracilis TaxID=150966 RepID=A0AAD3RVN6_NEPGR|nr:hypothetical protein Nepgr_000761 [Nepenthes gracilis]
MASQAAPTPALYSFLPSFLFRTVILSNSLGGDSNLGILSSEIKALIFESVEVSSIAQAVLDQRRFVQHSSVGLGKSRDLLFPLLNLLDSGYGEPSDCLGVVEDW